VLLASRRDREQPQRVARVGQQLGHRRDQREAAVLGADRLPAGAVPAWRPKRKEIPKGKPDPERPSKCQRAREILCLLAKRFPERMIHMVGDAAYASGAFADMPANVTITSRLKANELNSSKAWAAAGL
jgi:hypothetical protein